MSDRRWTCIRCGYEAITESDAASHSGSCAEASRTQRVSRLFRDRYLAWSVNSTSATDFRYEVQWLECESFVDFQIKKESEHGE